MKAIQKNAKYILLLAVLGLCFLLAGCYVPPDDISDNQGDVAAGSNNLTFDTIEPVSTSTLPVVTQAPATNPPSATSGVSINWNEWDNPSQNSAPPQNPQVTSQPGTQPGVQTSTRPGTQQGSTATQKPVVVPTQTIKPTSAPTATTSSILKKGSKGDAVKAVQKRLKELGYYTGSADGDFGDGTEKAVKAFQKTNGLTVDGVVGATTLKTLNSANARKATATVAVVTSKPTNTPKPTATPNTDKYIQSGSSGKDVKQLQNRLIQLGWLSGSATGDYDGATELAVVAFQKKSKLWQDGKAGPNTLTALYSSNAAKSSTPVACIGETLQLGSKGEGVKALQKKLISLGYLSGSADGTYGEKTEEAVKALQRDNGIKVDGKAGTTTMNLIFSGVAQNANSSSGPSSSTDIDTTISSTGYVTLKEGAEGQGVKDLQQALKKKGFYKGSVDGKYGSATTSAVYSFQSANSLKEDGIAGPATQRALYGTESTISYSTIREGDRGSSVSNLQYTLYELGYYDGKIDGIYGDTTKDAVRAFQSRNSISPVDGIAGNKTLQKLYSSSAISETKPNFSYETLKQGDYGDKVVQLQDVLKQLGYLQGEVTGVYDTNTVNAVSAFQTRNGLKSDGIAGNDTQAKLYSDSALIAN